MVSPLVTTELADKIGKVATLPVIGISETSVIQKKNKVITRNKCVQIRAWEAALIGGVAVLAVGVAAYVKNSEDGGAPWLGGGDSKAVASSPLGNVYLGPFGIPYVWK